MSKDLIKGFLEQMKQQYGDEVDAVALPDGTSDYLHECIEAGELDTLIFMLKISYLMGMRAGYSAQDDNSPSRPSSAGPMQA